MFPTNKVLVEVVDVVDSFVTDPTTVRALVAIVLYTTLALLGITVHLELLRTADFEITLVAEHRFDLTELAANLRVHHTVDVPLRFVVYRSDATRP